MQTAAVKVLDRRKSWWCDHFHSPGLTSIKASIHVISLSTMYVVGHRIRWVLTQSLIAFYHGDTMWVIACKLVVRCSCVSKKLCCDSSIHTVTEWLCSLSCARMMTSNIVIPEGAKDGCCWHLPRCEAQHHEPEIFSYAWFEAATGKCFDLKSECRFISKRHVIGCRAVSHS